MHKVLTDNINKRVVLVVPGSTTTIVGIVESVNPITVTIRDFEYLYHIRIDSIAAIAVKESN